MEVIRTMIFIAGASGFVGGHLVAHLREKGFAVKALARSAAAAQRLTAAGCTAITGDITEPETLRGILNPEDMVIHLVGIILEQGGSTFQRVHVEGTRNLVSEAKRAGVSHFFYQSALGADLKGITPYLRTKAEAEEILKASGLSYTIFRPSLIIGPWDGFTKKMLEMIKISPLTPIPGDGTSRFQPLYIKDWLKCIMRVIETPDAYPGVYELGGPQQLSYSEIVQLMTESSGRARIKVNIPMGLMKIAASLASILPSPPVTLDQLLMLEQDNITGIDTIEKKFGFTPMALKQALSEFIKK
ncbi:MAG: complex I NDUFA9 subunit family protein [Thermodesulfovibrio sp.]|nr:complex I NDUFA9 subunit family protein [Thermodesulfovibrio sp.]